MMPPENGEKILQSQEDSPEFQAVYMPREELFLPLPARRSAFEDRAPACHRCVRRDHMATVDRTQGRGGARCATGKNGGFPLTILKPRPEGYETEILANLAFRGPVNRITCMRKPQSLNALTVWVFASGETRARRLTAAKLHGTSPRGEQSSTETVAEMQMDDRRR